MLTEAQHKQISNAVAAAEEKSSGEIFCVLAHEVSTYREIPFAWGVAAAFVLPPLALLLGRWPVLITQIFSGWSADQIGVVHSAVIEALSGYVMLQALLFVLIGAIVAWPPLRRRLTPGFLKQHRVRQAARHHFIASGFRLTDAEPHILIFASLFDRRVEIVAHKAIHDAVGDKPWRAAADAVVAGMKSDDPTAGFIRAIEICGAALATHFPSDGVARNVLPNDILET
jgi:putative membrane protein